MTQEEIGIRCSLAQFVVQAMGDLDDAEFADKLQCSESLVYQLRSGFKNVTVEHIAQIAAIKGMSAAGALAEVVAQATSPDLSLWRKITPRLEALAAVEAKPKPPSQKVPGDGKGALSAVPSAVAPKPRRAGKTKGSAQPRQPRVSGEPKQR